jgi:hypothetical protein
MSQTLTARSLDEYLRQRRFAPDAERVRVEWQERLQHYLADIGILFGQIQGWLQPFKETGSVSYSVSRTLITEENLETYEAPEMTIFFADQRVVLRAAGTNIFGALGRVDILGKNGTATLVLKQWGQWQFFRREYQGNELTRNLYTDLTEEDFKTVVFDLISD